MANIAEITEELVNLTAQEVNELSHVLSKPDIDPICVDKNQDYFFSRNVS